MAREQEADADTAAETTDRPTDDAEDWPRRPPDVPDDWVHRDRAFRGISVRLAVHYLGNLGGEVVGGADSVGGGSPPETDGDGQAVEVTGDGWQATLSSVSVGIGPTVSLTEVRVAFAGDPDGLDELIDRFAQKAMRAGG